MWASGSWVEACGPGVLWGAGRLRGGGGEWGGGGGAGGGGAGALRVARGGAGAARAAAGAPTRRRRRAAREPRSAGRARSARLPIGHPDRTRALRRLARELEGAPSRRGEVLGALREVHQQIPADADVAISLARLARHAGDIGGAAEALMRAFRAATPG